MLIGEQKFLADKYHMRVLTTILFMFTVIGADAQPASSKDSGLPSAFHASHPQGTTGTVLVAQIRGDCGRDVLTWAFESLQNYFGQHVKPIRAIESIDGKEIQALFTASLAGQAIRGFAYGSAAGGGRVTILYDWAERFGQSLPALARETGGPGGNTGTVQLHRVRFADGTGWLSLPDGWRITATNNGVASAEGPQGAVDFGLGAQIYTPQFAARSPIRPPVVANYGDPARAIQELFQQWGLMRGIRVLERAPAGGWDGPAEYLHFQAYYQGAPSEILALVLERMIGYGTWFFYYSQVRTPASQFEKNLPVLLEIWKSWKTDDRVFQQRLNQAMQSMQACSRIINEVNANRQQAMDRSVRAWDNYIRGTWPVEDTQTHTRYNAPLDTNPTVQRLNEAAGYERWRAVPYQELNQ